MLHRLRALLDQCVEVDLQAKRLTELADEGRQVRRQTSRLAARWQAIAALAGLLAASRGVRSAAWLFVGGAGVFAGSLYAMAAGAPSGLGLATPFGGGALIAGWAVLAWAWARDAR